jgi:hypothetical protein
VAPPGRGSPSRRWSARGSEGRVAWTLQQPYGLTLWGGMLDGRAARSGEANRVSMNGRVRNPWPGTIIALVIVSIAIGLKTARSRNTFLWTFGSVSGRSLGSGERRQPRRDPRATRARGEKGDSGSGSRSFSRICRHKAGERTSERPQQQHAHCDDHRSPFSERSTRDGTMRYVTVTGAQHSLGICSRNQQG